MDNELLKLVTEATPLGIVVVVKFLIADPILKELQELRGVITKVLLPGASNVG